MHSCPRGGFASQGQRRRHAEGGWVTRRREGEPSRGAAESRRLPSPIPEAAGRAGGDGEGVLTATPSLREFHFSKDWAPLSDLGACIKALS